MLSINPFFESFIFKKPGPAISIFSTWSIFCNNKSFICSAKLIGFNLFFFAKTIGIKKISGGIGKIIDSKNENKLKNFYDIFNFPQN